MTIDQTVLFAILVLVFTMLIWGRWRYDLVAFAALMVALITGVVPVDKAFSGFGHPATVIIALVLIVSRGLSNSGVVELVTSKVIDSARALSLHISIMAGVAVGGTVLLEALVGGPMTGASMNPARSLGPALASGHLEFLWIYLPAPSLGAFLAYPTCRWIQGDDCCVLEDEAESEGCGCEP